MWTLVDALILIRELQPLLREQDYHLCLGGGVLNRGTSEKDLDLFLVPLNGYESKGYKIVEFLRDTCGLTLKRSLRDSPDYGIDSEFHFREAHLWEYMGKRIDIFIQ